MGIASSLDDFATEAVDLVGRHIAKIAVERIAGFELLAIDQERIRARQRVAGDFIEIAEQRQRAVVESLSTVLVFPVKAGDIIINQLRDGCVLAHNDEARRDFDTLLFPKREGLRIVAIEGL
jgi:hypothetical protein